MATFGDWKKLPSLSTKSGSPFIKYIGRKSSLLCTTGQKHVDMCSPQDGRSKHTWSVRQSDQLTSPAVFDPIQEDFVIVVNHNTLYKWRETTNDILKGRKAPLEGNVHTLVQCDRQEPILLFEDGRISRSSSPNDYLCDRHDKKIIWADSIKQGKKRVVCEVTQGVKGLEALVYVIEKKSQSIQPQKIMLHEEQCIQYCLQGTEGHVCLLTLSASGDINKYMLTGPSFGDQDKIHVASEVKENALMCALDDSHVVITQTKQGKDGELGLGILDLKFNTMKTWSAYPVDTKGAPLYLTVINDSIVVGVASGVYQCQCSVTVSTLGSVLGRMAPSEKISATNLETLVEPLLDRSKTKDYKSFKSAFSKLSTALKENTDETVLIQQQLCALVKRCLSEKQFFPEKQLLHLISESLVPAHLCMDTIKKLQDNNNLAGIHSCLIHIKDIPEPVIVLCLQYFLDMDASKFPSVTDEEMRDVAEEHEENKDNCPLPQGKAAFVNGTLTIPFNELFLLESLKKLEFDKCVVLLGHLRYLLTTLPEETNKRNNNWAELSHEKVVIWLGLILDAHFTQMIISPDAGRILVDIQEVVESQMSYYNGMVQLENMIHHFLKKVNIPKKQYTSDYCIEKIVFL